MRSCGKGRRREGPNPSSRAPPRRRRRGWIWWSRRRRYPQRWRWGSYGTSPSQPRPKPRRATPSSSSPPGPAVPARSSCLFLPQSCRSNPGLRCRSRCLAWEGLTGLKIIFFSRCLFFALLACVPGRTECAWPPARCRGAAVFAWRWIWLRGGLGVPL